MGELILLNVMYLSLPVMILNILNVCCLKYFEILGEIHNKYKWSQQDFQRPHKHSSHAGSCLEMLVWMTLNWWYDKLKSGKVFNVKNPIPERFPHTISQSFTWLRTFTSKPWYFQSSYCVASSMKSSIKVDIASLLIHYVLWRGTIKGRVCLSASKP